MPVVILTMSAPLAFSDTDWPSILNRPTFAGVTLTWVGPAGGGANNGRPVQQSRALTNSGNVITSGAGQIIEGLNILGNVRIRHNNVILRQCRAFAAEAILIECDLNTPTGVVIEDCLFDCTTVAGTTCYNPDGGGGGSIIRRCNLTGAENGIGIGENAMQIQDNWIHDLFTSVTAHTDGIQGTGGYTALTITHNAVYGVDTSCTIQQNEGAGFSGLSIDNNQLVMLNGSAAIIIRGDKGVGVVGACSVTNNHLGKSSGGTYNDIQSITGPLTYTGNVDWITGAPVTSGQ